MTGKNRPIELHPPVLISWTPSSGILEVPTGSDFDVVRVRGLLGLEACAALVAATAQRAGAVVMEDRIGDETRVWVRFLVCAGHARTRVWPPGTGVPLPGEPTFVPAYCGNTWPYSWLSRPTAAARLADVDALFEVLCDLTGWVAR